MIPNVVGTKEVVVKIGVGQCSKEFDLDDSKRRRAINIGPPLQGCVDPTVVVVVGTKEVAVQSAVDRCSKEVVLFVDDTDDSKQRRPINVGRPSHCEAVYTRRL
jgi:hypothetical protein